jgi:hypothetical protein
MGKCGEKRLPRPASTFTTPLRRRWIPAQQMNAGGLLAFVSNSCNFLADGAKKFHSLRLGKSKSVFADKKKTNRSGWEKPLI